MAKATAELKPVILSVTLELTPEEARALLDVTEMIAGDPVYSRRRHFDAIGAALRGAGMDRVPAPDIALQMLVSPADRCIWFNSKEERNG